MPPDVLARRQGSFASFVAQRNAALPPPPTLLERRHAQAQRRLPPLPSDAPPPVRAALSPPPPLHSAAASVDLRETVCSGSRLHTRPNGCRRSSA
jgi:hypothetical protein